MNSESQRIQPTPRFYIVAVMAMVSIIIGVAADHVVAVQMGCFLGALLVWARILAKLNFRDVDVVRRCPERMFARDPFPVHVTIRHVDGTKPVLCLEYSDQLFGNGDYFSGPMADAAVEATSADPIVVDQLMPGEEIELVQRCTIRNRGIYAEFDCQMTSRFPFGLFQQTRPVTAHQRELIVYPHPEHPPVLEQLFAVGMGTGNDKDHFRREVAGEFRGLREYDHGDPVKLIHWPLSARYQNLVVKDFDPVAPEEIIIVFHSFWAESGKQMPSSDYALQVLAGMFMTLHHNGTEFSFFPSFNSWDEIRVNDDPETLDAALEALAKADIAPMPTLEPLSSLIEELPEDDRRVIVFSNTPTRYWRKALGDDNALICLDCQLELDLESLSAGSRRRRLEGALS